MPLADTSQKWLFRGQIVCKNCFEFLNQGKVNKALSKISKDEETPFIQGDVGIDTDQKVIFYSIRVNRMTVEFNLPYRTAQKIAEGTLKQLEGVGFISQR